MVRVSDGRPLLPHVKPKDAVHRSIADILCCFALSSAIIWIANALDWGVLASTPASPAARGWWFSPAKRRPSRSRVATYRAGDAGRTSTDGFGSARPPHRGIHRRQIEARGQ